jgi:hypothetical protein
MDVAYPDTIAKNKIQESIKIIFSRRFADYRSINLRIWKLVNFLRA